MSYADVIFHSLELTASEFKQSDAVTRAYVDSSVTNAVTALVDNAPAALDTLRELGVQITSGSTAAAAITASLGTVQTGLANEIANRASSDATQNASIASESTRALAAESLLSTHVTDNYNASVYGFTDLDTRMVAEQGARAAADTAQTTALTDHVAYFTQERSWLAGKVGDLEQNRVDDLAYNAQEKSWVMGQYTSAIAEEAVARVAVDNRVTTVEADRIAADDALSTRIQFADDMRVEIQNGLQSQVDQKLDVSTQYQKREDGSLQVNYLYFSDVWRMSASTAIGSKRLCFDYFDGVSWSTAVPFIRPSA